MGGDQNPSAEPRRVGRPPYGLPMRDRHRSGSLGWRRYATPVPPRSRRRGRSVIMAGVLACIGFGLWVIPWSFAGGSSPRTALVSMPPVRPMTAPVSRPPVRPMTSSTAAPKTSSTAKSRTGIAKRIRRAVPVVPLEARAPVARGKPTPRVKRAEKPRRLDPVAGSCDALFPPSRPENLLRNQACREVLE